MNVFLERSFAQVRIKTMVYSINGFILQVRNWFLGMHGGCCSLTPWHVKREKELRVKLPEEEEGERDLRCRGLITTTPKVGAWENTLFRHQPIGLWIVSARWLTPIRWGAMSDAWSFPSGFWLGQLLSTLLIWANTPIALLWNKEKHP